MASLRKVAEEAGVQMIECPHCKGRISLNRAFKLLFQGMLRLVKAGKHVMVPGFGRFEAKYMHGRSHKTPVVPSGEMTFKGHWVMRFKWSQKARTFLNDKDSRPAPPNPKKMAKALAAQRKGSKRK